MKTRTKNVMKNVMKTSYKVQKFAKGNFLGLKLRRLAIIKEKNVIYS